MNKIQFSILLIVLTFFQAFTQSNISLNLQLASLNVFDSYNSDDLELKLATPLMLIEPGISFTYDRYVNLNKMSMRFEQNLYLDAGAKLAGNTSLGLRFLLFESWKHSASFWVGPSFYYRQPWYNEDDFYNNSDFEYSDVFEYKLLFISGGLSYFYQVSKMKDLCFSINHSYPHKVSFSIGYRFWISKKITSRRSCNCPHF